MMTTGEWGEFFHPSLSPFGYNETVAQEYYPLCKEDLENLDKSENLKYYSPKSSNFSNFFQYGYHRSTYEAQLRTLTKLSMDKIYQLLSVKSKTQPCNMLSNAKSHENSFVFNHKNSHFIVNTIFRFLVNTQIRDTWRDWHGESSH